MGSPAYIRAILQYYAVTFPTDSDIRLILVEIGKESIA